MLPNEICHRFKSKDDFLTYFSVNLQKYVPPRLVSQFNPDIMFPQMVNKDFIRQILEESKQLLDMEVVRWVNVPKVDELSVKELWPHMQTNQKFMRFFPDQLPKGRNPDRDYFFNVLNTIEEKYCQQAIVHANQQRHTGGGQGQEEKAIVISSHMQEQLAKFPF